MEELTATLRASKTAVRAAFRELEAEGLLVAEQEV
jgi:DNA-binding GntR family transcriptional regulator